MTGETVLAWSLAFAVLLYGLRVALDLLAHYGRYRRHLRMYPATRRIRGSVWRSTS